MKNKQELIAANSAGPIAIEENKEIEFRILERTLQDGKTIFIPEIKKSVFYWENLYAHTFFHAKHFDETYDEALKSIKIVKHCYKKLKPEKNFIEEKIHLI